MIAPAFPPKKRLPEMQPLGPLLEKMLSKSLKQTPNGASPLLAWPLACGHAVSERTRALSFAKNILTVEVQDLAWRAELRRFSSQYLAILNRYCREDVNRIDFVSASTPVEGSESAKRES